MSASNAFQGSISLSIKEKSVQAIFAQWVKSLLVIPSKAGIWDDRYR